jgi:hypothetical protein
MEGDGIVAIQSVNDVFGGARVISRTDQDREGPATMVILATSLVTQAATHPTRGLDELSEGWAEHHNRLRCCRWGQLSAGKEFECKLHVRA